MSSFEEIRAEGFRQLSLAEGTLRWEVTPLIERRQPIHVLYGGADRFGSGTLAKIASLARKSFETYAPTPAAFGAALGCSEGIAPILHDRVAAKLARQPIEDYRIDFEDGYGVRSPEEEDGHVTSAARALAEGSIANALPPHVGIRIKSLGPETRERSVRTLEKFLRVCLERARELGGDGMPSGFVVTLPKVRGPVEVSVLATWLDALEVELGIPVQSIPIELMVETPTALLRRDGSCALPQLVRAGRGRCVAVHLGAYDLTASVGIVAHQQRLTHPLCDLARELMVLSLSGSGVALSDGATVTLPIEPHRGSAPTNAQRDENRAAVHGAWRHHADNVRHGLVLGIYQGWDLHPAQIPARLAALYVFFMAAEASMAERLTGFLNRAARATRLGQAFDDAATGQGLLNFFDRGLAAGAFDESVLVPLGLTANEVQSRSFSELVQRRQLPSR